jgi:hypothetical protein
MMMRGAVIFTLISGASTAFLHREEGVNPQHHAKTPVPPKDQAKIKQIEARLRIAEQEVKAREKHEAPPAAVAAVAKVAPTKVVKTKVDTKSVPKAKVVKTKVDTKPVPKAEKAKVDTKAVVTVEKLDAIVRNGPAKVEKTKVDTKALPKVQIQRVMPKAAAKTTAKVALNASPKVEDNGAPKESSTAPVTVEKAKTKAEEKVAPKASPIAPVIAEKTKAVVKDKAVPKASATAPLTLKTKMKVDGKVALKAVAASSKQDVVKATIAVVSSHNGSVSGDVHDHAVSAQNSAAEAQHHLEEAMKAYNKTVANVKDIVATGKKIEDTAGDIKTIYTPPSPKKAEDNNKSGSRALAAPTFALLMAAALGMFFGIAY